MTLVLAAATEGAVPGLPQGPRHPHAVGAGCSGGMLGHRGLRKGADPDCPRLDPPCHTDHSRAEPKGHRRAPAMRSRRPAWEGLHREGRNLPHLSSGMQSAEWRRCRMVPSEQTQPSPSTWHCSGSSGPSIPSWHDLGGSQAATQAW